MEIKPWLILWFNKLSVRTGPSTWVGWVEPRPVFPCVPATGRCYFFHLQYDVCIRIRIHSLINVKLMIPINSAIMHPGGSWLKYIYIHIYLKNIIFLVWLDIIALCCPTTASAFSRAGVLTLIDFLAAVVWTIVIYFLFFVIFFFIWKLFSVWCIQNSMKKVLSL